MKKTNIYYLSVIVLILCSCSKDDTGGDIVNENNIQGLCPEIQGVTAIYWELGHGIPAPLTQVPLIPNPGQRYIHSQFPGLGFTIPQSYTPFEIADPQTGTRGVNVIRNDDSAIFRYVPGTQAVGQVSSQSIIANEINSMFSFFNFTGTPEVVCRTLPSGNQSISGIPMEFNARLLRFNNMTAIITVRSLLISGSTFSSISAVAAPTSEFETEVLNTFLPINFELLVGPGGSFVDKDEDGVPALEDPDDNNPNVP
ncbi:hypothetical protein [Flagellimonas sp. S3867]|uniref:hypothetical protein n=1 Tax=Flagellimonas sp. S3867 TaxID=2768063 RepID=UPI00168711B4|nr:hypothetical protein [Flagellimonas sp. S3867]